MIKFLEDLFGPNWRTSFIGALKALVMVIAATPNLIDFLPEDIRKVVVGICLLVYAVLAYLGGTFQRDRAVPEKVNKKDEEKNVKP